MNRQCTDFCFVIVFFVFMAVYGYSVSFAYINGKPDELFRPVNQDGKLCGYKDLIDHPKLYYIVTAEFPDGKAVCIDKCPKAAGDTFKC